MDPTTHTQTNSTCLTNIFIAIFIVLLSIVVFNCIFQNSDYYNLDNYEYGLYEPFTDDNQKQCDLNVDYTASSDIACRNWYLKNVLHLEMFTDKFSQDDLIDTLFALGDVSLPIYTDSFSKLPDFMSNEMTIRTTRYITQSVDRIHGVMKNSFAQLKDIVDTSTSQFDPYVATCSTQITMASILFEWYNNIVNEFFLPVSESNNITSDVSLTMLYLMPLMLYLKTHITSLIESALIVLNRNNKVSKPFDVSSIASTIYNNVQTQISNETSVLFSANMIPFLDQQPIKTSTIPSAFLAYKNVIITTLTSFLRICQSKVRTIQSMTNNDRNIQNIINGDLIHVYYRAFLYAIAVLKNVVSVNSPVSKTILPNIKQYEALTRRLIVNSQEIAIFDQVSNNPIKTTDKPISIDTALNTFKSAESLRQALLTVAHSINSSLLNTLAKYNAPGTIGTVFMQVLTSKSEILSMPVQQAAFYISDYISTLPEEYLTNLIPTSTSTPKVEHFTCDSDHIKSKRFSIGKCIHSCLNDKKRKHTRTSVPRYELFGDGYTAGTLQASANIHDYNTHDEDGNTTSDNSSHNPSYVPALDAPYPILQSQSGMAAYDIRGIPDIPVSTAPVSGLPGRVRP